MQENDQSSELKSPRTLLILLILAFIIFMLVIFLKQCTSESAGGGDATHTVPNERELIPSQLVGELSDVTAHRGAFGVKAPDGEIYFLRIDDKGRQVLIDSKENSIYEFTADEKVYIAGISNGRILLLFKSPDTQFTDPRQTWEGVRQHYAISIGAANLGLIPIFHSEEDVAGVLSRMK